MPRPKLSVEMTPDEYDLIRRTAEAQGETVSSWTRRILLASVPGQPAPAPRAAVPGTVPAPVPATREEVTEAAFQHLDDADALEAQLLGIVTERVRGPGAPAPVGYNPLQPPHQAIETPTTAPKARGLPVIHQGVPPHPCRYLKRELPAHFGYNECQGLCQHPAQQGRVCFWAPQAYTSCDYSRPIQGDTAPEAGPRR